MVYVTAMPLNHVSIGKRPRITPDQRSLLECGQLPPIAQASSIDDLDPRIKVPNETV
jgi:hypothetical protein